MSNHPESPTPENDHPKHPVAPIEVVAVPHIQGPLDKLLPLRDHIVRITL